MDFSIRSSFFVKYDNKILQDIVACCQATEVIEIVGIGKRDKEEVYKMMAKDKRRLLTKIFELQAKL
jgi:hypothetical protein